MANREAERMPYWRIGRRVGRTVYQMAGVQPSDRDVLIGMMDTVELARDAVDSHNWVADRHNTGADDGD